MTNKKFTIFCAKTADVIILAFLQSDFDGS